MKKDHKKEIATYTAPRGSFEVVTVPVMQFLMLDGQGDPNTSAQYADALAALYPAAYKLKFFSKNELDRDYVVMPLEALWWSDDMSTFTTARDKSRWSWTVMNMVPDWITPDHFDAARSNLQETSASSAIAALRLERFEEGLAVQTLHTGPYDAEGPVLARMHDEYIPSHALRRRGKHHEIYLNDPRRTAAEKLKTILRQPVEPDDE